MATPLLFPPLWCWATTWELCFTKGTANLGAMDINQSEALHCRPFLVDNNKRWGEREEDKWRNILGSSHLTPAQSCSLVLNHNLLASMCSCKLVNCPNQLTCFAHFDLCTCVSLQVQSKKYERNSRAISYVYTQPIVKLLKNFLLVSGLDMSVTPSLVDLIDVTLATN